MTLDIVRTMFVLLVAHCVADFPLQGDTMAKLKNRHNRPDWLPPGQKFVPCWTYWLSAHAFIHGGAVYLATGMWTLGIVETVSHWIIDWLKCENFTNANHDQLLHFIVKCGYLVYLMHIGVIRN